MKNLQIPEIREIDRFNAISLNVPENIDLSVMSDEEIERLALDLSRQAASTVPQGSSLLGIDGISLTNTARPYWEFGFFWTRSCAATDIDPSQMTINPELFEPIVLEKGQADSLRLSLKAPRVAGTKPRKSTTRK